MHIYLVLSYHYSICINIRSLNVKKAKCDEVNGWYTFVKVLGITAVVFLLLVSIADSVPFVGNPNSSRNNVSILNKYDEAIKAYDKEIEINPQNSSAWNNKGLALDHLNKLDEAIIAYEKAIEINPDNSVIGMVKELL